MTPRIRYPENFLVSYPVPHFCRYSLGPWCSHSLQLGANTNWMSLKGVPHFMLGASRNSVSRFIALLSQILDGTAGCPLVRYTTGCSQRPKAFDGRHTRFFGICTGRHRERKAVEPVSAQLPNKRLAQNEKPSSCQNDLCVACRFALLKVRAGHKAHNWPKNSFERLFIVGFHKSVIGLSLAESLLCADNYVYMHTPAAFPSIFLTKLGR